MTRRAAARKRSRPVRPESDSSLPREQDRDSSRRSFCVSPLVVGVGRGFGIHLTNVSTASLREAICESRRRFDCRTELTEVVEARLSMLRRVGASENDLLTAQGNLATSYEALGRKEQAISMRRDVYSGRLKLNGEEHLETLRAAYNYANSLFDLKRFQEAKTLLRKIIPVARRVIGEGQHLTLRTRLNYAEALYEDPEATRDDLREAISMLEDLGPIARRVLGGAHPFVVAIAHHLLDAQATLRADEWYEVENA